MRVFLVAAFFMKIRGKHMINILQDEQGLEEDSSIEYGKKPLSVYIHIPFCIKKCKYCDFLSFPVGKTCMDGYGMFRRKYVESLCEEIESYAHLAETHNINTIYIGGGTPSVLDPDEITVIMDTVRRIFDIDEGAEISIEVNPGTLTSAKAKEYIANGINRMSIGLQSAQSDELKALGRIHNYDQFIAAFDMAREAGFRNINIDLMSDIPGQSMRSYLDTLEKVLRCRPEHISSYSLIVEEGTPLAADRTLLGQIPDEDVDRQMYEATNKLLDTGGYHRYEISNYARSGYECRHNIVYWTLGEYIGVGIGAASFLYGRRYTNTANIEDYVDAMERHKELVTFGDPIENAGKARDILEHMRIVEEELDSDRLMEEYMFLGLRMISGVSAGKFNDYFGRSIYDVYGTVIDKYTASGHLEDDHGLIRLTPKGIDVSNTILADFLID